MPRESNRRALLSADTRQDAVAITALGISGVQARVALPDGAELDPFWPSARERLGLFSRPLSPGDVH